LRATNSAHEKLLRGRKLIVTFAHQAPLDQGFANASAKHPHTFRKAMGDSGRPTTLSLLKSGTNSRNEGTENKIALMEAKLRQMEKTDATSSKPYPPLPPKPPTSVTLFHGKKQSASVNTLPPIKPRSSSSSIFSPSLVPPRPSEPVRKPTYPETSSHVSRATPLSSTSSAAKWSSERPSTRLSGVKIAKHKIKEKDDVGKASVADVGSESKDHA